MMNVGQFWKHYDFLRKNDMKYVYPFVQKSIVDVMLNNRETTHTFQIRLACLPEDISIEDISYVLLDKGFSVSYHDCDRGVVDMTVSVPPRSD